MQSKRVAVLRGGPSTEYDVSLLTGAGVIRSLEKTNHIVKDVVITKQGEWLVNGFVKEPEKVLLDIDVVFLALHGSYGEDGTVQRLLERYNIPYTGSGPYASAISLNKHLTKEHLKEHGVLMPKHMKLTRNGVSDVVKIAASIAELFGPTYVVKPLNGGSSIDILMVDNPVELSHAINTLLRNCDEIIVEERIHGREATAGILESFRNEKFYQLPTIEIIPPMKSDFFSADIKYTGETEEICPGRFTKAEKSELSRVAQLVHNTLNLKQYSRSDFIVTPKDVYFLEVNTLPGLTAESLFPKSLIAVGSSYDELVNHLITTA